MKWLRRGILFAVAVGCIAMLVWAFVPDPVAVEVATLERGEFVEQVEEPARTRVRERFVVSAPLSGELLRIHLKPGARVQAGEPLAHIRPLPPAMFDARTRNELTARLETARASQTLAAASIDRAKALEAFAIKDLERLRVLVARQAAPARDLERAELELEVARKDVRSAELSAKVAAHELDVARAAVTASSAPGKSVRGWAVSSPLSGRVLRVLATSEGVVAAGTPLLEVGDTEDLEVVAALLTTDAVRLAPGARSHIERWGGAPLEGRVRLVEPAGYTKLSALGVEEQRVDVVIDIVDPPAEWAALGDGFRVHTRTELHREPSALKAPATALFRDGDGWALFVIDRSRASKRQVAVERRSGIEAMLGEGLPPGTRVVAFPSNTLADGARVAAR